MSDQANAYKALTLSEAVVKLDGKEPLPFNKPRWDALYTRCDRREIDKMIHAFPHKSVGFKCLLGGHSGNGKSTELNRFKGDQDIRAKFFLIDFDVTETMNPYDLEFVELLLVVLVECLAYAEAQNLDPYQDLSQRLDQLQGFFRNEFSSETTAVQSRQSQMSVEADAEAGGSLWLVKLKTKFLARLKGQSEFRQSVRTQFRPKITDLIDLLNDLLLVLVQADLERLPLIIIDGLDRMPVDKAKTLFVDDGQNIALIRNCAMLLTIPISQLHATQTRTIESTIGPIVVCENLCLTTKTGGADERTLRNRQALRDFILRRLDASLIDEKALEMAVHFSGGVFRTLLELLASAAESAEFDGLPKIGEAAMREAVRGLKVKFARPMYPNHMNMLAHIHQYKRLPETDQEMNRELLQGLYALEYINGEPWYDINPLLADRLARHLEIEQQINAERES